MKDYLLLKNLCYTHFDSTLGYRKKKMYILNLAIFQTFACTTIYGTATNRVQRSIQNAPGFPFRLIQDPLSLAFIAYEPSMLTPLYYREAASLRNTHGCTSMGDMCSKDVQTKQSYTTTYNKRSFFFYYCSSQPVQTSTNK